MNIFLLDYDLQLCAQYHCDKHIVKMPTETAQLLSSAYYSTSEEHLAPYKRSHYNNPLAIWCRSSIENWMWLSNFGIALYDEYQYRYDRSHQGGEAIKYMLQHPPSLQSRKFEYPPQSMPDQYKDVDPVIAYRAYYNGEKYHLFHWTKRQIPPWVIIRVYQK